MKIKLLSTLCLALVLCTACESDSTSDEFDNNNPNAVARLISQISLTTPNPEDDGTVTINYDANNRVTSVTDGVETNILAYDNDDLTTISGPTETTSIQEILDGSPYDVFESGDVISYDANNNPQELSIYDVEYDWMTDTEITVEYRATISYDNKPNPYFYTLQAAGIIEIMDNVELNLSPEMSAPELVQARLLFPSRNVSGVTITTLDGELVSEVVADYVYNSDDYPTSGTITETIYEDGAVDATNVAQVTYTYLPSN